MSKASVKTYPTWNQNTSQLEVWVDILKGIDEEAANNTDFEIKLRLVYTNRNNDPTTTAENPAPVPLPADAAWTQDIAGDNSHCRIRVLVPVNDPDNNAPQTATSYKCTTWLLKSGTVISEETTTVLPPA